MIIIHLNQPVVVLVVVVPAARLLVDSCRAKLERSQSRSNQVRVLFWVPWIDRTNEWASSFAPSEL